MKIEIGSAAEGFRKLIRSVDKLERWMRAFHSTTFILIFTLEHRNFFTNGCMHPQVLHYLYSFSGNVHMTLNYPKIQIYVPTHAYQSQTHTLLYFFFVDIDLKTFFSFFFRFYTILLLRSPTYRYLYKYLYIHSHLDEPIDFSSPYTLT